MNRLVRIARNPWILTLEVALMIYALAGFSLIPYLVQRYVPKMAAEQLKRSASIGEVNFNPFLFAFEARDFRLKDTDGQPVFQFNRLLIDFELESIFRRAWTFADFRLETPLLKAVVDEQGKLNLAKIAEARPKSEKPEQPDEALPRLLVKHLAVMNGSVEFTDHSKGTDIKETVSPIDLELDSLTTLPEKTGSYELVSKLPGGGTLKWRGNLSLQPILSDGDVHLDAFSLAIPWKFLRDRLNLAEPSGLAALSAHYQYRQDGGKADLSVSGLGLKLSGLRFAMPDAADPILALERVEAVNASFDLARRSITVPSFIIQNGLVNASVDAKGSLNWQNLVRENTKGGASNASDPPPDTAPQQPWKLTVENFKIADLGLTYADASRRSPYIASVDRLGLDLQGDAQVGAGMVNANISALTAVLNGITLTESGSSAPLATWDLLELADGRFSLDKREVLIGRAALKGGKARVVRDKTGTVHVTEIFTAKNTSNTGPKSPDSEPHPAMPAAQPWHFALNAFTLEGFNLGIVDHSFPSDIVYDFENVHIGLNHVTNDGATPVAFDADLNIKQGGVLKVAGSASPKGDRAEAKIQVDRVNLNALHPLVAEFVKLKLERGDLSTAMNVDFVRTAKGPSVKSKGALSVSDLLLNEAESGKRFLAWKKLSANGIDVSLAPNRLSIQEVRIDQPGSTITIFEDRSTNLAAIFNKGRTSQMPAKKATASKTEAKTPFPVKVERIRVDNGIVDFSDRSLVIPFSTLIHNFKGMITDVSTTAPGRTHLAFEGRVDEFGSVKVDGALNPMQQKKFSDINVVFRNVAMTSLSPYSATFAGRKIQSGKLDLDLQYKIEDSVLKSESKIVLDHFTLGERVESPNAVSLPLDLAVAVLTDSQGQINVSVPVEGDIDNPKFRYGKLVWEALMTVIQKAVTAPFRMIGSVFAGDEEHPDTVLFEPGSDVLSPPEREKIKKFATMLEKRPMLKLVVHGQFDPQRDGEALRSLHVRQAVAEKLDVGLKPGEDPGPLAFTNAKTQRALEDLTIERGGPRALEDLEARYQEKEGRRPQRVGRLTALFGRASEDQDFYEFVLKHLVSTAPSIATSEFEALANRRATAIRQELTGLPGVDRTHVGTGKIESTSENIDGKVPSRLEPGAVGG